MEIKVKEQKLDSYDIANGVKPSRVFKLTGYISNWFSKLESMRDVDRLLKYLLETTIMDEFDYVVEIEVTKVDEGRTIVGYLSETLGVSDYIAYFSNSFERCGVAEYTFNYDDVSFTMLIMDNKVLILSVEDKLLNELANKL